VVFFGVRWLRKAILRYAGIVALHDEDLAYRTQLAALRHTGLQATRFDWAGFLTSTKATLLEGLEVAFLVITLGAASGQALTAATLGAAAALLAVLVIAAALRRPLTRVPENDLKAFVGTMLCTFGVYWFAEGLGVAWAGGAAALLYLFATFAALAWLATRLLRGLTKQAALAGAEPA
jgi:Ca2+/H+ antiporter, TMEM165/GDT1 family